MWRELNRTMPFYKPKKIGEIENVQFVTWNSGAKEGIFEQSMEKFDIPCEVLGQKDKRWNNSKKIDYLLEFLKTCDKKYIVGVDSYDAMLVADPSKIINWFESKNKKIIFNASVMKWPEKWKGELKWYDEIENEESKK